MNVRDSSIKNYIPWDSVKVDASAQTQYESGMYLIENDFSDSSIIIDPATGRINRNSVRLTKVDPIPATDELKWKQAQLRYDDK